MRRHLGARRVLSLVGAAVLAWVVACGDRAGVEQTKPTKVAPPPQGTCPERGKAPELMPGTTAEQMRLEYWLGRYSPAELDRPLLSVEDVAAYDRGVGRSGKEPASQRDLLTPLTPSELQQETRERLAYLRDRVGDGRFVDQNDKRLDAAALAAFASATPAEPTSLRVALGIVPIRCGPFPGGLFEHKDHAAPNLTYDRNACSAAHEQELIELLGSWPSGMLLARTRYALGWLDTTALGQLSAPLPKAVASAFVRGPRMGANQDVELSADDGRRFRVAKHTSLPLLENGKVAFAAADGFHELSPPELVPTQRPLTRRALLTTAFGFLDSRYAFGDANGGRDCSRFLMDLFESFDVALPRHSAWQAEAGNFTVDLRGLDNQARLRAIDAARGSGVVLLALPGHIMLDLGKNAQGTPMALHALGEYVQPCAAGKGETVLDVQRTVVSDLTLGKDSSRRSLLERLTTLVVLGSQPPAPELAARATVHALPPLTLPAAHECKDNSEARVFLSPQWAAAAKPFRVIATTRRTLGAPALWLFGPDGKWIASETHRLGPEPLSLWARIDAPSPGKYTAVFADGTNVLACKRVLVHKDSPAAAPARAEGAVWNPHFAWEEDTLNLWSAFVEQLFMGAPDDETTWNSLHALLRNPERNLLYDHFSAKEDERITLVPDCADLPYSLRAYFAWKLRLPFGYRQCSRGKAGVAPRCGALLTNMMPREAPDDVDAFTFFVNRHVRNGVHSATGRTLPDDPETDLYPVALERASLPPGTVYADPYGHVMIVAKWFPQGQDPNAYGILIAAEAQPDGTVGRRRFFPGSFLFDPNTTEVGAGFKQFRPLVLARGTSEPPKQAAGKHAKAPPPPVAAAPGELGLTALDNAALTKSDVFAPFSLQQYQGSKEDFYERMDRLINPMPLDPHGRLKSLLDALEESVRRRVLSVDNGEKYFAAGHRGVIAMPPGYDIFETAGPWEDFATPSRDMRLLIAIDTVLQLPAQLEKYPDRFKLAGADQVKAAVVALRAELEHELGVRKFSYTRSDGKPQELALKDVLARADALELGYDPNDCVEVRWGAPDGSAEQKSCTRHAPAEQHARMLKYRSWFHTRTRPVRGTAE